MAQILKAEGNEFSFIDKEGKIYNCNFLFDEEGVYINFNQKGKLAGPWDGVYNLPPQYIVLKNARMDNRATAKEIVKRWDKE